MDRATFWCLSHTLNWIRWSVTHDRFREFLKTGDVHVSVVLSPRRRTLVPAFLGTCFVYFGARYESSRLRTSPFLKGLVQTVSVVA